MKFSTSSDIQEQGTLNNSLDFSIDPKNFGKALTQFSKYASPIPSIIREIVSNAKDAVNEAEIYSRSTINEIIESGIINWINVDRGKYAAKLIGIFAGWERKPIEVSIIPEDTRFDIPAKFIVEDHGVGISPRRMKGIYSKYLSSTKTSTNSQIGAFGLGAKSPLGYTDIYNVTTVYNGIEYNYSVIRGDVSPLLTLNYQKPAEDKKYGTTISIDIKSEDFEAFKEGVSTHLMYFDDIKVSSNTNLQLSPVVKYNSFIYSRGCQLPLHICIGNVYYPIDFSQLDIDPIKIPFGLYFSIDEVSTQEEEGKLSILWNRESLQYNDETITTINNKINELKKELYDLYSSNIDEDISVKEYLYLLSAGQDNNIQLLNKSLYIPKSFLRLRKVPKSYRDVNLTADISVILNNLYNIVGTIDYGKLSSVTDRNYYWSDKFGDNFLDINNSILKDTKIKPSINRYITYTRGNTYNATYIIQKKDTFSGSFVSILLERLFGIKLSKIKDNKEKRRKVKLLFSFINEVHDTVNELIIGKYSDFSKFSEEYTAYIREKKAKKIGNKHVALYDSNDSVNVSIYSYNHEKGGTVWSRSKILKSHINDPTKIIIYGTREYTNLLEFIYKILANNYSQYFVYKVSRSNLSEFEDNPNATSMNDLLTKGHRSLQRAFTAHEIRKFIPTDELFRLTQIPKDVSGIAKSAKILYEFQITHAKDVIPSDLENFFKKKRKDRLTVIRKNRILSKRGLPLLPVPPAMELIYPPIEEHFRRVKCFLNGFPLIPKIVGISQNISMVEDYITLSGKVKNFSLSSRYASKLLEK